jgi:hypothetical protein
MSWYVTGDDAKDAIKKHQIKRLQQEKERRERKNLPKVYRFWMPPSYVDEDKEFHESSALVTFVDAKEHPDGYEMPFAYMEHNIFLNGNWKNWFTCIKNNCPLCKNGNRPYLAAAFTVVDHRKWQDKKGNVHQHEIKLYVAKSGALSDMLGEYDRRGGVRGWRVRITREGEKTPGVGSKRDFVKQVSIADKYQPLDYGLILAPKSEDFLRGVLGDISVEGASSIEF